MLRKIIPVLAIAAVATAGTARAQIVTWGGGFPNDRFSVSGNWAGDVTPQINGTATIQFTGDSDSSLNIDENVSLAGITVQTSNYNESSAKIFTSNGSTLTIGTGGASIVTDGTTSDYVTFQMPVILSASQIWSQTLNQNGSLTADASISGAFGLTLLGDSNTEIFVLNSGGSTYSGGTIVTGLGSTLALGFGSTGPAGAPTSGPVGTGTLSLGDGTILTTSSGGPVTLANPVVIGDLTGLHPVVIGGPSNQGGSGQSVLALSGPVTLNDSDLEIDIGQNSAVTFSGALAGYAPGVCLDFGSTGNGNSLAIVRGNITNVSRLDLEDNVSVILDGAGPAQIATITDIGTSSTSYLGVGSAYSSPGTVAAIISFLNTSGSTPNIYGSLGFDTTSGPTTTFVDPVDLTNFTASGFVGLGSATSAILGPAAVITPPGGATGTTYPFGGGGGMLTVQSALSDGPSSRNLNLLPGNAPLTLILSGALTYTGQTSVAGAALILDTPPPPGSFILTQGYIGSTTNSGYSDGNSNIQSFVALFNDSSATGVVGFDSFSGQRTVSGNINMISWGSNLFLGTATSVLYSGTITPNDSSVYPFAGVKGGQVTVSSTLSGSTSVIVGLVNPIESFNQSLGYTTLSSVTLSGTNTYTGNTTLNSGYLYVTNNSSLGTGAGTLEVPGNTGNGWAGTLATQGAPVTLTNPISVEGGGLALNTGSSFVLTLMGNISDMEGQGSLGIFGPVVLGGTNSYSGGTFISGTTVTVGSDTGLGTGWVNADNSTLAFTSPNPILAPQTNAQVNFQSVTATFSGSPVINNLQMSQSTLNFNGPTALIDGIDDQTGSNNHINLPGTVLTIDTDGNGNNFGGTYHGIIAGTGSLIVTGNMDNGLELRGADTYSGGTLITLGNQVIASNNSALGTGPVTVIGGALVTNTGVTITNPITLDGSPGNIAGLAGFGTFSPGGNIAFENYNAVDPGRAAFGGGGNGSLNVPVPGRLTFGGGTSITFGSNGGYLFALTDGNGAAGTGYSTISLAGSLSFNYTGNPFKIYLFTYDPSTDQSGLALNFIPTNSYSWTLVSAGSISGFNPAYFSFDTTSFANSTGVGSFFVSQVGNDLMLNFTPVPEPSTWMLMASGLCALGAAFRRRRR